MTYAEAVDGLLEAFAWNPWFLETYWPENEPRVRLMARLAQVQVPAAGRRRTLEVGCANGYVACLFSLLGFDVSAIDTYDDEKRSELFQKHGIRYHATNLNELAALRELTEASFDLVLMGEVFEHILNQSARILESVRRLLRPGGVLILTTPNPSTIMNACGLSATATCSGEPRNS